METRAEIPSRVFPANTRAWQRAGAGSRESDPVPRDLPSFRVSLLLYQYLFLLI